MNLYMSPDQVSGEIERIRQFLSTQVAPAQKIVLGLSGGVDSDVTARLAVRALGPARVKLFTVVQANMEASHLTHARRLAQELGLPLVEMPLATWPAGLIDVLSQADPGEGFSNDAFLDIGRAKNSLRTVIYSTYHDRGYLTLGTSNRTEIECGFFVRLGDGIWHLGPIAHLYKTQVYQLAAALGSAREVIEQAASAGYWQGQSDLEDLAYWLVNLGPIGAQRRFDPSEIALAETIWSELSFERIDRALQLIAEGTADSERIASVSALTGATARRLHALVEAARGIKNTTLGVRLDAID